jgi:DNA-binding response OmpR family regulator
MRILLVEDDDMIGNAVSVALKDAAHAVDFLIHGVRKKLGADVITNVRGAGWLVERRR